MTDVTTALPLGGAIDLTAQTDAALTGTSGTSTLTGGPGPDTFTIVSSAANTTILNFSHADGDKIDLTAVTGITSFTQLMAETAQNGADTVIDTGAGVVTLKNITATSLTAADFQLAAPTPTYYGYPYDSVCYITDTINGVSYRGSGVLIGPHTILTASHLLWDSGSQQHALSVTVYPGYAAGNYTVAIPASQIHYNLIADANDEITQSQAQNDFAVIDFAQNLSRYGWFGTEGAFTGGTGAIGGYPASNGTTQVSNSGQLSADPTYHLIDYSSSFQVSPGSSGGPIWIDKGASGTPSPYVVGVASTSTWGAQITPSDLSHIRGWISQDAGLWKAHDDFNGLGYTDTLFRSGGGDWGYMPLNGWDTGMWHDLGTVSLAYTPVGGGDFSGDSISDVVFRNNSTGDFGYNTVTGGSVTWHDLGWSSPNYAAVGVGDFNGDGTADVAFRNSASGDFGYMATTNGAGVWHDLGWSSPNYVVIGVGDFNGDGTADVAFRNNASGDFGYMAVSGGAATWQGLGASDTAYAAIGVGDFNGDGADDLAFRDSGTGEVAYMAVINGIAAGWHDLGPTDTAYSVIGVGNYDGHGRADVAFRDSGTGALAYLAVGPDGATPTWRAVAPSATYPLPSFAPLEASDPNNDGVSELALRDPTSGQWGYLVQSSSGSAWHAEGWASPDYTAIGQGNFDGGVSNEVAFRNPSTGDWGYMATPPSGASVWHALGWSSAAYAAIGAGDFNGDHATDMAFRNNSSGDFGFMTVSGSSTTWHDLGWSSPAYAAVGAGDFNGDGTADIAFRNASSGDWGYMAISGGAAAWHALGWSSPAYAAIATGDFNGDGHVDMAFRNASSGDWGYMTVSADQTAWHDLGWSSTAYAPVAAGDFNGDHITDMAFRSASTGDYGYMTVSASGATAWHDLASATAYMAV